MNKRDFIFVAIICILIFISWKGCTKKDTFKPLYEASQDSLHQSRNELGQQITTTALMQGSISDLKEIHADDTSAIGKLQKMVNKLTISATYLKTITGNNISSGTGAVISHDTVWKDGRIYIYPEYRDTVISDWENIKIIANKDSFHLDYKIFNEFELTQSWHKNGIFKRRTAIASITNLNPHTETKELKTFTITENKSNRLRDALIGAAAGALIAEGLRIFNIKIPINLKFK